MEEWEYCLLWASPRKTVVVKPGSQVETLINSSRSQGILVGLQAEGWQTVAFNTTPTADMTYLFKRKVQSRGTKAGLKFPSTYLPMQTSHRHPSSPPH